MVIKNKKPYILFIIIIISFFDFTNEEKVIIIYLIPFIFQSLNFKSKYNIRKLWEEEVNFRPIRDEEEKDSIEHCQKSDYKYKIFYAVGQNYNFPKNGTINNLYDAVSYLL